MRSTPSGSSRGRAGSSRAADGARAGTVRDLADDAAAWLRLEPLRLAAAARDAPRRQRARARHLRARRRGAHGAVRRRAAPQPPRVQHRAGGARQRRHEPLAADTAAGRASRAGKFENLNALLAAAPPEDADWVIVVDDDVELPRGFLDRFLRARALRPPARPARAAPHQPRGLARWSGGRAGRWRAARGWSRSARVTAFHRSVAGELLPFPAAAHGMGPRRPLGRAGARARLAPRRGGRDARSATSRAARPAATTATPRWRNCGLPARQAAHRARHRPRGRRAVSLPVGADGRGERDGPDH